NLLATVYSGTDAYVRSASSIKTGEEGGGGLSNRERGGLNDVLVDLVRSVPGVGAAEADVQARGVVVVGRNGTPLAGEGHGGPALGGSWRADRALNPFRLVQGTAPT